MSWKNVEKRKEISNCQLIIWTLPSYVSVQTELWNDFLSEIYKNLNDESIRRGGGELYSCNACLKSFSYIVANWRDIRGLTSSVITHSCEVCMKTFRKSYTLKVHIWTHTGQRSYTCVVCIKYIAQNDTLTKRMRTYTGDTVYLWSLYETTHSEKNNLTTHSGANKRFV